MIVSCNSRSNTNQKSPTIKTTKTIRKSKKTRDLNHYVIIIAILILALTIYVGFRMYNANRRLIPISVLALLAGVFYESRRLSEKWQPFLLNILGSFILSFIAFLPNRNENGYNFESHIEIWPYIFVLIFIIFSIIFHSDKVTPKLTEGITLLQSVSVIYWVIDYGFLQTDNFFLKSLMIIGLIFSLFSVFHALTHAILSRTSRLTLSIWSSIVMLLFASYNIYSVYQNEQIENTADLTHGLYIALQYFLLGISGIYIVQNFLMLSGFFPGRDTFFNKQYYKDLEELKSEHIKRYSKEQVSINHSIICLLLTGTVYFLNYHYKLLPRHITIWSVFVLFPFILLLFDKVFQKKNYS